MVVACDTSSVTLAGNQELRVNIGGEPGTLDPGQQQYVSDAALGRNTFEALLKPTQDLKDVTGGAADSYTVSTDGTVYTFKLHRGAKWSDGQPVKAADFVYAWQRLVDPRVAASYAAFYTVMRNGTKVNGMNPNDPGIEAALQTLGLEAIDDDTFRVTLEAPAGYFKWVAALWTGAPIRKDVVAKAGKDSSGNARWGAVSPEAVNALIGNGQFKISEVVPKDHITLVPNPNYSGRSPKPTLTKITLFEIADDSVAYAKYKSGELDMAAVPLSDTKTVQASPELIRDSVLTVFWIDFNVKKAPFDNLKVRQAFSEAIDREAYVKRVLQGRGLSATTLIPKGMRDYGPEMGSAQRFDLTNARANLKASGMTVEQLNGMDLKLYYTNFSTLIMAAEFVQAQLKTNLGINVALEGADQHTNHVRRGAGNYTMYALAGWGADYPDSQDWFDVFLTDSTNQFNGWSNAEYDQTIVRADILPDGAERDQLYARASRILASDAPVIFFYQPVDWTLVRSYVKNVTFTPIDDFPGDFHLDSIQIARH